MTLHFLFTIAPLSLTCQCLWSWAIVMHMEPYVCGIQSKCQLTKALSYHEALWRYVSFWCDVRQYLMYCHYMVIIIGSVYTHRVFVSLLCDCRSVSPWKVCESTFYVSTLSLFLKHSQSHIQEQTVLKPTLTVSVTTTTRPPPQYFTVLVPAPSAGANSIRATLATVSYTLCLTHLIPQLVSWTQYLSTLMC